MAKKYLRVELFSGQKSRGTFDDFYDNESYDSLEDAYTANDYVECDFVKDEEGIIYIECKHSQSHDVKKYHRLNYQRPVFGIDALDDGIAVEVAISMFKQK